VGADHTAAVTGGEGSVLLPPTQGLPSGCRGNARGMLSSQEIIISNYFVSMVQKSLRAIHLTLYEFEFLVLGPMNNVRLRLDHHPQMIHKKINGNLKTCYAYALI
jgi:hypothetical protein